MMISISILTAAMGYEAQMTTAKDTEQEKTKEVLVVKTRTRKSSCGESRLKTRSPQ
jgi:hypothetical protein